MALASYIWGGDPDDPAAPVVMGVMTELEPVISAAIASQGRTSGAREGALML